MAYKQIGDGILCFRFLWGLAEKILIFEASFLYDFCMHHIGRSLNYYYEFASVQVNFGFTLDICKAEVDHVDMEDPVFCI